MRIIAETDNNMTTEIPAEDTILSIPEDPSKKDVSDAAVGTPVPRPTFILAKIPQQEEGAPLIPTARPQLVAPPRKCLHTNNKLPIVDLPTARQL